MSFKKLEGYVGDNAGLPLDGLVTTVVKVADGSAVASGTTNPAGLWSFAGLATADEYFVKVADGAGRAVVRGPWSGELRTAWVRDRLEMPAAGVAVLPGGANTFLGTLAFDPPTGDGALDHRYVDIDGDTMTGALVVPGLTVGGNDMSQAALDARYINTAGDAMTGLLTVPSLSVAGNDISYPSLDTRYVNATGDAMTGSLAVPALTVAGVAINQTTLDARYINATGDAMSGGLTIGGLAVAASPDASNALEWRANGFFATAGGGGGPSGTNVAAWVTRVATQSVAHATDTPVSFDTEVRDDGSYWTSGSPTRITIPTTGWYGFAGWIIFEANTAGIRFLHLRRGGTDFVATTSSGPHATDGNARLTVAMNLYLVAGDYIEMLAYHNRGVGLTLTIAGALSVVGLGAAAPTGAPTTAPYITTAPDAGLSNEVLLASVIGYGANAAMPAVGIAGRLYYDTTNSLLMRDSGSAWQSVEGAGGGGGLTKAEADTYYEPLDSAYTKAEADARYEPVDSAYTKAEADARYPQKTDLDPYPTYLTQTEGDARYPLKTDPDPYPTYLTVAEAGALYEPLDSAYTKSESDARYEPLDSAYTKAEADARYTQGGITQAAADLRYEPLDSAYTKAEDDARFLQLTGGSVMTGVLGPSTHNTRDLGTTALRWRALYGMTADLTTSLTVASKAVGVSATGGNTLTWNADGFYVAAGAVTDIWVNTLGDTMTGDLNMTANVLPTVTNTRDLGTTALRWRKLWGVDTDLSGLLTVATTLVTDTSKRVWVNQLTDPAFPGAYSGTPGLNLQLEGTDRAGLSLARASSADADTLPLNFWRARGTFGSKSAVAANDYLGKITGWGWSGANWLVAAQMLATATGTITTTAVPGMLQFLTANSAGTLTERLRVDSVGVVNALTSLQVNSRPVIMAGCRVTHNAAQTITTAVTTALAFNTERYDTDAFHDTVTNNSRLTIPAGHAGKYYIFANIAWGAATDAGWRLVGIRLGGVTFIARQSGPATTTSVGTEMSVSGVYDLAAGDYLECMVRHERGSNLDVTLNANFSPEFGLQRIG